MLYLNYRVIILFVTRIMNNIKAQLANHKYIYIMTLICTKI